MVYRYNQATSVTVLQLPKLDDTRPGEGDTTPHEINRTDSGYGRLLALLLISVTGCNRLKARDQLNKGVQAFKNARYEEAVNHFQTSIELDPNYDQARLYLATAYSYQVVPNLDTPENLKIAQKAIDGFQQVLAKDPNDLTALKQIASIYRNTKKLDLAKSMRRR